MFNIEYDLTNGGVKSIVCGKDNKKMNWVEGDATFGTIKKSTFISAKKFENGIIAIYQTPHFDVEVTRKLVGEKYVETYELTNRLDSDVFIRRGDFGIYATFNDSYENTKICMSQRCHAHIWCGRNSSYVRCVKMGGFEYGLGLVLTKGSLDCYSVERDLSKNSDDRGDFILHPTHLHLLPHEKTVIEWELFWFKENEFDKKLRNYPNFINVDAPFFTIYNNEKINFTVSKPNAQIFLNGNLIPSSNVGNKTLVEYTPTTLGEHIFTIRVGENETKAEFFVQIPFRDLLKKRVEFIVNNQQFHNPKSPLDGAYLVYDNQDKSMHFDELDGDLNASRERLMMGLLVVKYLQYYPEDKKIYDSLMKYYKFVSREFYCEETGEVYNAIGRNPAFKRLYNAPWMSVFVMEMYKLTKDKKYLKNMFKLLSVYYTIGGENFYPNGLSVFETVDVLRQAGMNEEAEKLTVMYNLHASNIVSTGIYYPEHEVKYEQSIVTPAVNILAQAYLVTKNPDVIPACRGQLDILEKFNNTAPSHHLYEMAIRHWDGKYFGKRQIFGDTFPHPASVHTLNAYLHYYWITGDESYKERAYKGARNLLSLYRPDGSASNCYVYPFSVNGVKCEYYDEYANDQDGAMYYLVKFYRMHEIDG